MLSERFEDALVFATRLHASQRRKGTAIPYVAHLLAVTALVLEHGGTEDEAIAALLHDAVEDQGGAAIRAQIRSRFGEAVAIIVDGCTDADVTPKPPWRARKETYLAHLAAGVPSSVLLVSVADKLHNARAILSDYRTLGATLWERFNGGRSGTLWYYRALVQTYRQSAAQKDRPGFAALVAELDRTVTSLEQLVAHETDQAG
jgi:GTP pyrophosphokinase